MQATLINLKDSTVVQFTIVCVCVCVCMHAQVCIKYFEVTCRQHRASQVAPVVKNPFANAGAPADAGSIPESGRSPGVGNGKCSCLENSIDRGA